MRETSFFLSSSVACYIYKFNYLGQVVKRRKQVVNVATDEENGKESKLRKCAGLVTPNVNVLSSWKHQTAWGSKDKFLSYQNDICSWLFPKQTEVRTETRKKISHEDRN